jgi:hydrogenase/urease accessory protein HupE
MRPGWLLGLVLLLGVLGPRAAEAHAVGLSRGQYRALPDGVEAELVFARTELGLDADTARRIVQGIHVSDGSGQSCPGELLHLDVSDEASSRLLARYHCRERAGARHVELDFWDEVAPGHRQLVSRAGAEATATAAPTELCQREQPRFELPGVALPDSAASSVAASSVAASSVAASEAGLARWVQLGSEHILGGYDHLAFLLALVLVARTLRGLAATVSVFTLAHSVTLALATLDVLAPPSGLVECAIALSICYVGIENLSARAQSSRRWLVFAFGLTHGFGFAGALRELGLRSAHTPLALFGFNLGVELGQLGLLACAFPLVLRLRRASWFQARGVPALSAAIALAGALWFAGRLREAAPWQMARPASVAGLAP